jgi:transcriptional regulator with XRE-family HTH domain
MQAISLYPVGKTIVIYQRFFPHMATHKLANYIRAYRKKSGLSQREVAYLLGCETGAQVSRYERRRRMPPVQTALACQAVFGTPVADLFAGTYETAAKKVKRRAQKLGLELQKSTGKRKGSSVAQKLQGWATTVRCNLTTTTVHARSRPGKTHPCD